MSPRDLDRRCPAVAGRFYPADPKELRDLIEGFLREVDAAPESTPAAIVPHAGLIYSGQCAARVFARVRLGKVVVIIAPNHTGRVGAPGGASVWERGSFKTPLGDTLIAEDLAHELISACPLAAHDPEAHLHEHAIEVELPFLTVLAPATQIVPIVVAWSDWDRCRILAGSLAQLLMDRNDDVVLIASSDMTHYESAEQAATKDRAALEAIEELNGAQLLDRCERQRITMCGRAPAAIVVETARQLGASCADVVDYRHSGWVTGDDANVVAYAGVVIK